MNTARIFALVFALALYAATVAAQDAPAAPDAHDAEVAGWWEGSLYGSGVVARMDQDGQMLSGVVTVTGLGGRKDVYHVAGAVFGDKIYVLHGAGHVFEGVVADGREIRGVLTTAGGKKLELRAARTPPPPDADAHPRPDAPLPPAEAAAAPPNG